MGINGLLPLLRKHAPGAITERPLAHLSGRMLPIDITIYLYRWQNVGVARGIGASEGVQSNHYITGLVSLVTSLLRHDIVPVIFFEGRPPAAKTAVLHKRKAAKNTVKIYSLVNVCKNLLGQMGVPYYDSPGEAEAQCVKFAGENAPVASEDSDVLAYGGSLVSSINLSRQCYLEFDRVKILEDLRLSAAEFTDLCIYLGNDYNARIYGPVTALKKIRQGVNAGLLGDMSTRGVDAASVAEARRLYADPMVARVEINACARDIVDACIKNNDAIIEMLASLDVSTARFQALVAPGKTP